MSVGPGLFDAWPLRGVTLRNRIVVSPMCQYSSVDGLATDWHLVHLGGLAVGGAAVVFTEAAAVLPEGRISPNDLGVWSDDHVEMLSRIFRFVAGQGALPGMQLAHAGRKASTARPWEGGRPVSPAAGGWQPVAPSAVPFAEGYPVPEALDEAGIARVVDGFRDGARRALAAGAQVLEIHAAHGYLLHQFLSPVANRRADRWGGDLAARTRLVRAVARAVREVWPERLPLFTRLSTTDWMEPDGWTVDDSVALARLLREDGVDLVDCSSGGIALGVKVPVAPGYQTGFAARIRREAGVATGAVGMLTSAAQCEHVLRTGQADVVVIARELLRNPRFPLQAAFELGAEGPWPPQYLRAKR